MVGDQVSEQLEINSSKFTSDHNKDRIHFINGQLLRNCQLKENMLATQQERMTALTTGGFRDCGPRAKSSAGPLFDSLFSIFS